MVHVIFSNPDKPDVVDAITVTNKGNLLTSVNLDCALAPMTLTGAMHGSHSWVMNPPHIEHELRAMEASLTAVIDIIRAERLKIDATTKKES